MSDMNTMIPAKVFVKVGEEEIEIKNLKVGKLSAILRELQPIAHLLPKPGETPNTKQIDFVTLVIEHLPTVINITSLITDKDKEWVEALDLDALVDIFSKVVEVNLDFFIQRVLPSVLRGMGQLSAAFQATEQNLSGRLRSKG